MVGSIDRTFVELTGAKTVGISDLELGTKVKLVDRKVQCAILVHVVFPTGSAGYTTDEFGVISKFAWSHDVTQRISFGYNVGYDNPGTHRGNLTYSFAAGASLTDRLGFFAETYGEWTDFDSHAISYDNGFTYLIRDNLQLDFSFGFTPAEDLNFYSVGASWRIPG